MLTNSPFDTFTFKYLREEKARFQVGNNSRLNLHEYADPTCCARNSTCKHQGHESLQICYVYQNMSSIGANQLGMFLRKN